MKKWKCLIVMVCSVLLMLQAGNVFAATTPNRAALYAMILEMQATISSQQSTIDSLSTQLAAVESSSVMALNPFVSIDNTELNGVSGPHVLFEGVNLHLRSGSGVTEERALTGLGNLIIGYNEMPDRDPFLEGDRAGSHNFVMGTENRFASYVGLVHGENNAVMDENSAAIAGHGNQVTGGYAAAIGGHFSLIDGTEAVAVGGSNNTVSGKLSVVTGGEYNVTTGRHATIGGGSYNEVSGDNVSNSGEIALQSNISNLSEQVAAIEASSVMALAPYVTVDLNELNGVRGPHILFEGVNMHLRSGSGVTEESALTGLGNFIIGYNEMPDRDPFIEGDRGGSHNFVMGTENRFASYVGLVHGENNAVMDENAAAIAGHGNKVIGDYAAAIGGHYNLIDGTEAVAVGGDRNTVTGTLSVVTGGEFNVTTGRQATIGGGSYNAASGDNASVSGGIEVQVVNNNAWATSGITEQ